MQLLATIDKVLLALLLPVWMTVFGLHVWSGFTRAHAGVAIYAAPPSGDDPYPTVGGFRPETYEAVRGLEGGERLLRVGDRDLKGVGYGGFEGIVLEQAESDVWVTIQFERDGEIGVAELRAVPYPSPWYRIPILLSLFSVGLIVMLRGRDRRQARLVFAGLVALAINLASFRGGPAWLTASGLWVIYLSAPIAFPLAITAMMTVPDARGRPSKSGVALAIACGLLILLTRSGYYFQFPISAASAPRAILIADIVFIVVVLLSPRWRRFPIGVPIACTLAALPLIAGVAVAAWVPETGLTAPLQTIGFFSIALVPIILLARIVTHHLFDVDRVLSATATYTLLIIVALGALLGLMPSIALGLSATSGLSTAAAQGLTSAALALALVPAIRWLRPRVERFFFPERREFADGIEGLRARLESCGNAADVLAQLGSDLDRLLHTVRSVAYLRRGKDFYACFTKGGALPGTPSPPTVIDAAAPTGSLQGISSCVALVPESSSGQETPLDPTYRDELLGMGFRVLLPIHRSGDLEGFLCLGEKHSGDDYSETELSLLSATADRASARLEHFVVERLADAVETADRDSLARSRFLATASHDLRQPLQALSLFAGALARRSGDDDIGDLARNIGRSTDALREMFDGLLDLSRIEVGSLEANMSAVPLSPLFERLRSELSPLAQERGLRLRVAQTSLSVRSDPALLGRILRNLVLNALRYTERGGVLLGARRRGEAVHLEVIDTGPGISPEHQQVIFQEFQRIADPQRVADEGLGLGLAIVDRLATLLGHKVELVSELGSGSRFTVVAERSLATVRRTPGEHVADTAAGLGGRAILVIDDDASIRAASRVLLEKWGCTVGTVASISEIPDAVEQLGGTVHAAIVDYRLGAGERGTEAIRVLRATVGRNVPAVLITGDSGGAGGMETGGLPVLSKPLAPARLRSMLVHLLRPDATPPLA